jgi:hypothetical protein
MYLPRRREQTTFRADQMTVLDRFDCCVMQSEESLDFTLELTSREASCIDLTVRLKDQQNQPVGWATIRPSEQTPWQLSPGTHRLKFSLPTAVLASGFYTAGFDIFNPESGALDQLDACLAINKLNAAIDVGESKDQDSGFGCVHFQPMKCAYESQAGLSDWRRAA